MPGLVLSQQFLTPANISQRKLAEAMGVSPVVVNHIVHGRNAITSEMALRLATATRTTPEYWLSLQTKYDLFRLRGRLATSLESLPVLTALPTLKNLEVT
jgi:addiction module HigA family antidote